MLNFTCKIYTWMIHYDKPSNEVRENYHFSPEFHLNISSNSTPITCWVLFSIHRKNSFQCSEEGFVVLVDYILWYLMRTVSSYSNSIFLSSKLSARLQWTRKVEKWERVLSSCSIFNRLTLSSKHHDNRVFIPNRNLYFRVFVFIIMTGIVEAKYLEIILPRNIESLNRWRWETIAFNNVKWSKKSLFVASSKYKQFYYLSYVTWSSIPIIWVPQTMGKRLFKP